MQTRTAQLFQARAEGNLGVEDHRPHLRGKPGQIGWRFLRGLHPDQDGLLQIRVTPSQHLSILYNLLLALVPPSLNFNFIVMGINYHSFSKFLAMISLMI